MNLEDRIAAIERQLDTLAQQTQELVAIHRDMATMMLSYEGRQNAIERRFDVIGRTVSTHASRLSRLEQGE